MNIDVATCRFLLCSLSGNIITVAGAQALGDGLKHCAKMKELMYVCHLVTESNEYYVYIVLFIVVPLREVNQTVLLRNTLRIKSKSL